MMQRLTVVGLAQLVDRLLQRTFPTVAVEGELAQVSVSGAGHAYLTLREGEAALQCVMWKSEWKARRYDPKVGERLLCVGKVGGYAGSGRWQLYATRLEPVGQGELARQLQEIRNRLEADGLLDPRRRRPLPTHPRVVGVATSLEGAALQDFLRVSKGRWPAARILVAGCTVQGPTAPGSVIQALDLLFEDGRAEVVVVTRGGGHRLDLLAFQDEQLARFVAAAPVPVVSAVGHEIDTSFVDLVADLAAPTPSAAAMVVFPDGPALAQRVDEAAAALDAGWRRWVVRRADRVRELRQRLRHPQRVLADHERRRAELEGRLQRALRARLELRAQRLRGLRDRLEALSPWQVLERGYAVVRGPGGVVRDPSDVAPGDPVTVQVAGGGFGAVVTAAPLGRVGPT